MSEEYLDKDLFDRFVTNRIENSDVDLATENPTERLKTVNTLFKILISIFQYGFSSQFDNDFSKEVWFNSLLVFDTKVIADGLELLLQDKDFKGIPNLKRFIFYCEEAKKGKNYYKDAHAQLEKGRLPKLKAESMKQHIIVKK